MGGVISSIIFGGSIFIHLLAVVRGESINLEGRDSSFFGDRLMVESVMIRAGGSYLTNCFVCGCYTTDFEAVDDREVYYTQVY